DQQVVLGHHHPERHRGDPTLPRQGVRYYLRVQPKGSEVVYAVIETGGKQYKVAEGDRLDVELLEGDEVSLRPVMPVDGETVLATPSQLGGATVSARVVGEAKGP